LRELLRSVPLSAIVLETDAPDIQPQWLYVPAADRALGKPQARNEPQEIVGIARFAAETLGLSMSQLAQITLDNVVHCLRMDAHVLTQPTLLKNKMASS
jgi:TatD DNase family protein